LVSASVDKDRCLKRTLTTFDLTLLGIGCIVGAGIFVLTGTAALKAGPGVMASFILAGIACALAALCYAEFASIVPVSGSVYTYTYLTMGEIFAWMIGWDLALEYLLGTTAIAAGWSGYFNKFLIFCQELFMIPLAYQWHIPKFLLGAPGEVVDGVTTWFNLPAFFLIMVVSFLLARGVNEFKRASNWLVLLKISVVVLFIIFGLTAVDAGNWVPFAPKGWTGVGLAAAQVFFAYIGFDAIATATEETKDPSKSIPRAILLSLGISTILYVLVVLVMTGVVYYPEFALNLTHPVDMVTEKLGINWLARVVNLGAVLGITTGVLGFSYSQTRLTYAMSCDGLLPPLFSRLHAKYATPAQGTWVIGLIAGFLAALVPLETLADLVSMGTLAAFTFVAIGVIMLRYRKPDLARPFRCPLFPVVPILSGLLNIALAYNLPSSTKAVFVGWLAVGLLVYLTYSRYHSKVT
jgi:APA family basic amino acid/polyamine antiporter